LQNQGIADEEPEEAAGWRDAGAEAPSRAPRADRPAVADEWLRRQVRRLLDQVGAVPSPAFLRRERSGASNADDTARRAHRVVPAAAAIVVFLLVLCLALTAWQWRVAQAAQARAERTATARDFLAAMLGGLASSSAADPAQTARMKDLLDGATRQIAQEFATDPRSQSELLGVVATMYGEIGEHDSRRALLALQRIQLRRVHGDAHAVLIGSLLDEAQSEIARGDLESASARLSEVDPLIARARLDDDTSRARWWLLFSDAQPGTAAGAEALDRAIAAFEREKPVDARLGEALSRKARRLMPTHPAQAEALFTRVAALPGADAATIDRRAALLGLAQAHEVQGEYEEALQALDEARALAKRELVADAQFAWALHREGRREQALGVFDTVLPQLAPPSDGTLRDDAWVRTYYAECLAAEGRPMQAIPLLEAASALVSSGGADALDPLRTQSALGDAYDRAGLWWKARDTLKASLGARLQREPADATSVAEARERWGRFLLGRGEFDDARTQFDAVLDQAGGRNVERVVLAFGGLARVALARHDWDAALTASTHAVVGFENLVGARDVRTGPYLWLIHAEALRNVDDYASARIWATRALDASRRYDVPDAASIREAQAVLARLLG
jgi:serine/threonine-protein kinase